ncbi:MAG: branched-chain amino acid ABC transporter permease [Eubacteriales bacterium]|nr:branched-chain amino acid ABC transporter permease [Eubacteriales bacterium]
MQNFIQALIGAVMTGSVYALIALGFNIIYRTMRMGHFAQGEFFMLGGYFGWMFYTQVGVPYFLAMLLACLSTTIVMLVVERIGYRTLYDKGPVGLLMANFAVQLILRDAAKLIWNSDVKRVPAYVSDASFEMHLGDITVYLVPQNLYIIAVCVILMVVFTWFMKYTKTGIAMNAVAVNRTASSLMGIELNKIIAVTYILAAFLAAIAGFVMAPIYTVRYNMGANIGMTAMSAAVMGGFGSLPGAMLGGMLMGLIEILGATYLSAAYKDAFSFIVLLVVLLVRPQGILGQKQIEKV